MKFILAGLLFGLAAQATACSCMEITIGHSVTNADEIYFATLVEAKILPGADGRQTSIEGRFLVKTILKGHAQTRLVTLTTQVESAACGVAMMVSATYVIFKKHGEDGINACSGSRIVESFQEAPLIEKVAAALKTRR